MGKNYSRYKVKKCGDIITNNIFEGHVHCFYYVLIFLNCIIIFISFDLYSILVDQNLKWISY